MASSSSRPSSVRSLYTPPPEEWVFLPPTVTPPSHPVPSPSHLPSTFPSLDDDLPIPMYGPIQMFSAEFFTTALGLPFEVGKTLLQIEYRPRGKFEPISEAPVTKEEDAITNLDDVDIYFTDRVNASSHAFIPPPPPLPRADQQGYFPDCALPFKDSSLTPAHPAYLLPDGPEVSRSNGVWGMIRRLRHAPSESLPALWKTQLISTVHSILVSLLQPQVSTALSALHPTPDVPLTALPSPAGALGIQVASHLLSHLILSPLEIVKTRLIAMPMGLPSTPSSVGALRDLIEREGGLSGLYLHPNLLIPTLLEHTLRPLLTLSIPLLLERQFNLSPDLSPITYSLCDLTLGLGSLLILLPIETVRKRLQIQPRDGAKRIKTIVRTREKHYVGVVEAMWRIMTEETGHPRKKDMKDVDEGGQFAGVRQLYRGFGMAATAHLTVFGLGLVSASLGGRGFDSGWKEI